MLCRARLLTGCQQYFFKAMSIDQITARLQEILKAEQIAFEEEALFFIARGAAGSMRDSQSILDQVIAYSPQKLTKSVLCAMVYT